MHIKVHIEANEKGYAYGDDPNGEQNIELEVSDEIADAVDWSVMIHTATVKAISDYKKALKARPTEEESSQ